MTAIKRNLPLLALLLTAHARAAGQACPSSTTPTSDTLQVVGMTAPSKVATVASVLPARIARIPAAEGSIVRQGDPVVVLDDDGQIARTEMARAEAESTLNIALARARWEYAKREWDRLVKLHGDDCASSKELSDAFTKAEISRLEYEVATLEHEQAQRAYERERKRLEEYQIRAPFTGYVAAHLKQPGETVDQLEGIVTLVQLDPLEIVVDSPVTPDLLTRVGEVVWVRPVDPRWSPRPGTIELVSRVADGASQTLKVKLSLRNEDRHWLSGLKVAVDLSGGTTGEVQSATEGSECAVVSQASQPSGDTQNQRVP